MQMVSAPKSNLGTEVSADLKSMFLFPVNITDCL